MCRGRQRKARQRCAAGKSQSSEVGDSNSDQDPSPSQLDWRKFRASLVAAERRGASGTKEDDQTGTESAKRESEGESAALEAATDNTEKGEGDIWAHEISAPETGCLLLARRSAGNMGFFNDSVIFMLRHGETFN